MENTENASLRRRVAFCVGRKPAFEEACGPREMKWRQSQGGSYGSLSKGSHFERLVQISTAFGGNVAWMEKSPH